MILHPIDPGTIVLAAMIPGTTVGVLLGWAGLWATRDLIVRLIARRRAVRAADGRTAPVAGGLSPRVTL